jgi:poly-gamma-glutamate capsule biosynthesis protein CapA/YwtB (metallophosphatase superfamily)
MVKTGARGSRRALLFGGTLLLSVLPLAIEQVSLAQQAAAPLRPQDLAMSMPGTFTLASVGDVIIRRPASVLNDEGLQSAIRLIRDADVAVGNMEGSLADLRHFDGALSGFVGTHEVAADLKAMGFDMLNRANNHLLDSEEEGMFATNDLLDKAGVAHAGSGRTLNEASAPTFMEVPKGRVALVGMHTPNGVASGRLAATTQRGNLGGRPGLNMLGYSEVIIVTPQQIKDLQKFRDELFQHRTLYDSPRPMPQPGGDRVTLPNSSSGREDSTFRAAREGEVPGTIDFTMNRGDLDRILRSVRNGAAYSDFTVATIHAHQSQSVLERFHSSTKPPTFLVDLAHQTIDQGAHAFVGHGPHILRGIEIYKGRPIFYGMGEFFRQMNWSLETEFGLADAGSSQGSAEGGSLANESILATSRYENGTLVEVRVYPMDLRVGGPNSWVGIPRISPPNIGGRILQRVQRLSKELGTNMVIEGNVGIIRVP